MKNLFDLLSEEHTQETKYVYFWKGYLSQWAKHEFVEDGVLYKTPEHYTMVKKAELFNHHTLVPIMLTVDHPANVKQLGRQVHNFKLDVWNEHCDEFVIRGNLLRFQQHPDMKQRLLDTGDAILVEASPLDKIWGVGLAAEDPMIKDPKTWRGLNKLGFALMAVRDMLRDE